MNTKAGPRAPDDTLAEERQAFERQRMELMAKYKGQYVAFSGGKVVDHDKDDEILTERMFEKLGDEPFYIGRVTEAPDIYELPSPEVVG